MTGKRSKSIFFIIIVIVCFAFLFCIELWQYKVNGVKLSVPFQWRYIFPHDNYFIIGEIAQFCDGKWEYYYYYDGLQRICQYNLCKRKNIMGA